MSTSAFTNHARRVMLAAIEDLPDEEAGGIRMELQTALEASVDRGDAQVMRECVALHSALTEAVRRLGKCTLTSGEPMFATADLLAVLDAPDTAPRPWERKGCRPSPIDPHAWCGGCGYTFACQDGCDMLGQRAESWRMLWTSHSDRCPNRPRPPTPRPIRIVGSHLE